MKLILTGASGFVASELIPLLQQHGIIPVLISDHFEALRRDYPDLVCDNYDRLPDHCVGATGVLHLTVKNNNTKGTLAEFRDVNVGQALSVLETAKAAGVPKFIFTSSFHTLALGRSPSDYSRSKFEAEAALREQTGIEVNILHMPALYGRTFKGKMRVLNRLPVALRKPALTILTALRPAVHASRVADRIANILKGDSQFANYLGDPAHDNAVYSALKRIVDLTFALAVLVVLGWLLLIIWIMIRLDSPGPGIFTQDRVGRDAKTFTCYKFRTMRQGTKQAGTHELSADSITRMGHFLRKTKIDELPQIINIAKNELSLIGPRPSLLTQQKLIEARHTLSVFDVKPGISGLGQIQNVDMSEPERLAHIDALYVAQQSLPLDLRIIFATFTGAGQGDKGKVEGKDS